MVETLVFPLLLLPLVTASVRAFEFSVLSVDWTRPAKRLFRHVYRTGHGLRDSIDLRTRMHLRGRGFR
jgi:hypothetical protein